MYTKEKWKTEGFCIKVGDSFCDVIAKCKDFDGNGLENAERIIHCVNNHDDLLEALECALYVLDELTQNTPTEDSEYLEQFALIHCAINKG